MKIQIGKEYEVDFTDCCVAGDFTSSVQRIITLDGEDIQTTKREIDPEDVDELVFGNGVRLTQLHGVQLEETGC